MNEKLITLYEQLEQLSSDLQVMMTRVNDMQQALAILTKEWLERTAPDVIHDVEAAVEEPMSAPEAEVVEEVIVESPDVEVEVEAEAEVEVLTEAPADIADAVAAEPQAVDLAADEPAIEVPEVADDATEDAVEETETVEQNAVDEPETMVEFVEQDTTEVEVVDSPVEVIEDVDIIEMDDEPLAETVMAETEDADVEEERADPEVPFDFDDNFDSDEEQDAEDADDEPNEPEHAEERVAGLPDLRKMFTLNDKYRFRRELFGNDNAAMNDTVNMLEAMTSIGEAEDYLYNDMGWDAESEEVKEFMTIVKRRFNVR